MIFTTSIISLFASSAVAMSSMASAPMAMSTGSSAVAASAQVPVYVVKVSDKNGTQVFTPNDMQVPVGAMVQFQFYPMNHSVVSASFAKPCEPISNANSSAAQLFSGFMPVKEGEMMPTYTVMINDTKPIWLYCSQAKHCQSGMVAAINAKNSTGKTLAAFQAAAAMAANNLSPGETASTSTSNSTGSAGSSAGASSAATAAGSSASAAASSTSIAKSSDATKTAYSASMFAGLGAALLAFAL